MTCPAGGWSTWSRAATSPPLALNVGIGAVLPGDDVDVAIARADTALARAVSAGPATYRILLDS